MDGERSAYDIHPQLIRMYQAVQCGWEPPTHVSEDDYQKARDGLLAPHEQAFIGFGCSFSGKWFGGYARSGNRNYASNARNSLRKKAARFKGVVFECLSYKDLCPIDCLVYCDPPYEKTTKYSTGVFDYSEFWERMRLWSRFNTVLVSSYVAPEDFAVVASFPTKTDMHTSSGKEPRTEKLFSYSP
jgi:DNA adenine methylase